MREIPLQINFGKVEKGTGREALARYPDPSIVNLWKRSATMPIDGDYTDSASSSKQSAIEALTKAKEAAISIDYLRSRVAYFPDTGELLWSDPTPDMTGSVLGWHRKWGGQRAFATLSNKGYLVGSFDNAMFLAHRVAWAIHHGEWPKREIDHINRVKTDNRLVNLRDVNRSINSRNRAKAERSLPFGVFWKNSKYYCYLTANGKRHYLGCFVDLGEAVETVARAVANRDGEANATARATSDLSEIVRRGK